MYGRFAIHRKTFEGDLQAPSIGYGEATDGCFTEIAGQWRGDEGVLATAGIPSGDKAGDPRRRCHRQGRHRRLERRRRRRRHRRGSPPRRQRRRTPGSGWLRRGAGHDRRARPRHLTLALPPEHAARLLDARDTGATARELQQTAADVLWRGPLRRRGRRAQDCLA
ncbi:hypothetical protein [Streptomyces sp. NPDC048266]|uniref:hypothetical protein n=1 Tax=Streptomyces sp. NPDC048266 TaxID=3155787 RepID=UPI0033C0F041